MWFSAYIVRGITEGFRIGYHGDQENLRSHMKNMVSAAEHPLVVSKYLEGERSQKRVAVVGTPESAQELGIHCSPFGVIPKKNKPNKRRLILDLSSPDGHSVNDGVQKKLASLSYMSVIAEVLKKGRGTELRVVHHGRCRHPWGSYMPPMMCRVHHDIPGNPTCLPWCVGSTMGRGGTSLGIP